MMNAATRSSLIYFMSETAKQIVLKLEQLIVALDKMSAAEVEHIGRQLPRVIESIRHLENAKPDLQIVADRLEKLVDATMNLPTNAFLSEISRACGALEKQPSYKDELAKAE